MTTGEKIKIARKKAGLTQKELGDILGVSQAAIGQFEKKHSNLQLETVRKIADALNVKLYELVDDWNRFTIEELKKDFSNNTDQIDKQLEKYLLTTELDSLNGLALFLNFYGVHFDKESRIFTFKDTGERYEINDSSLISHIGAEQIKILIKELCNRQDD